VKRVWVKKEKRKSEATAWLRRSRGVWGEKKPWGNCGAEMGEDEVKGMKDASGGRSWEAGTRCRTWRLLWRQRG
jgi:hypothetical protein